MTVFRSIAIASIVGLTLAGCAATSSDIDGTSLAKQDGIHAPRGTP